MNLIKTYTVSALLVGVISTPAFSDTISPEEYSDTLALDESVTITKTVVVEAAGPSEAPIDVHFLIDTSGSMSSVINNAKSSATNLFNELNSEFGDVQASVGVFSEGAHVNVGETDVNGGTVDASGLVVIGGGLTDNSTTFSNNVNAVTLSNPDGGGDSPESGYTGIDLAADEIDWRPGSNRFMFLFTDNTAKGSLTDAQAALTDNNITLVTLSYGSLSAITASYGTPFDADVFASSTTEEAIIADVTAGITAGFADYSTVTVDDLGNGLPEIEVSTVCLTADIGTCAGAFATGEFDRSVDRTFTFDVTFTRVAGGDSEFFTHALVDGGIVASEADSFSQPEGPAPVPVPAALPLLLTAIGSLAVARRRRKN